MYFNMLAKLDRMPREGTAVWIDPDGYHQALNEKEAAFRKEVAAERAGN